MEMITIDQFNELRNSMEEAQKDTTPFIGADEDEIHVFGDPNKTEVVSSDYTVLFGFPDTPEWRRHAESNGDKIKKEVSGYIIVERQYKDVFIAPRNMGNAVTALVLIEKFVNSISADGEVKPMTQEQLEAVFYSMNHEISDATYELVGAVMRIPQVELECMLPINAMENAVKIVRNNPAVVNEADLFFGSSLVGA